jgi:type VI secretion system protein ImpH
MGASGRRTDPSVADLLFERGYEFDFFQAVRLLARLYPHRQMVGGEAKPGAEVARFHALTSLSFPPSSIHSIESEERQQPEGAREDMPGDGAAAGPSPAHMAVAFMGLTGPQGVLPFHYTELLVARQMAKDSSLAAFFDLFNHRFISLFYRAWEKHHFPVSYERAARQGDKQDRSTEYLFDLIGMGTGGLRGRLKVRDQALLLYAGLIGQRPHSAAALRGLLRDYFGLPVEIEQFRGRWFPLDQPSLSYLDPEGLHNQLGVGAIAGDEVWNQQARFRVQVGPLTFARFIAFLPDGDAFPELVELTRYFAEQTLEFDVQLVLRAAEVPWCRLTDEGIDAPRLGWAAWLKTEEFVEDARDTVLSIEA